MNTTLLKSLLIMYENKRTKKLAEAEKRKEIDIKKAQFKTETDTAQANAELAKELQITLRQKEIEERKGEVCRTDNLRFRFVVCWYRDDGRCHEAACNKPGIYQYDGESRPYSGTWRWCRFGYDACRTEQLRNDCGIAELRITGRSGWCECDRISWRNSDSARR